HLRQGPSRVAVQCLTPSADAAPSTGSRGEAHAAGQRTAAASSATLPAGSAPMRSFKSAWEEHNRRTNLKAVSSIGCFCAVACLYQLIKGRWLTALILFVVAFLLFLVYNRIETGQWYSR